MASLIKETTAAEKKRLAKQRKKAAQKAKKEEKKEEEEEREKFAQLAPENKKADDDEYGENKYEKSKRQEPLIKKYLDEGDIKNVEDAGLLQKQRTLLLKLGDLKNMTDEQIDDLVTSIANKAHSHQSRWGGRKRKRTKKRKTRRKRKTHRKRKTRRKSKSRVKRRKRR